jgi:hypothetical protein
MRIEIELNQHQYAIDIDGANYTAIAYKVNQDKESKNYGKQTENTLGYCTTLANAALKLLREEIAIDDSTVSLSQFVAKYEALTNEIKEQFDLVKL